MVGLLMDVWRNSIRKKWDLPHFKQPKLEKTQNPVVPGVSEEFNSSLYLVLV